MIGSGAILASSLCIRSRRRCPPFLAELYDSITTLLKRYEPTHRGKNACELNAEGTRFRVTGVLVFVAQPIA
jgi:hypothetical protein